MKTINRSGRWITVSLEQLDQTQDAGTGAMATTWSPFWSGPAMVGPTGGDERLGDKQVEGLSYYEVTLRYMRGVTEKLRVNFTLDGVQHLLDIVNVNNVESRNRWMVLRCKAGVNRG